MIQSFLVAHNAGTPSEIYTSQERRLNAPPYERIPGIDQAESKQIVSAMIATGVWNAQGDRVEPDIADGGRQGAVGDAARLACRRSGSRSSTRRRSRLAVHQFTAEYAEQVIAFFTRYVP